MKKLIRIFTLICVFTALLTVTTFAAAKPGRFVTNKATNNYTVSGDGASIYVGDNFNIYAEAQQSGGNWLNWSTKWDNGYTISPSGIIQYQGTDGKFKALAAGNVTLSVNNANMIGSTTITIRMAASSVTINETIPSSSSSPQMTGTKFQLTANVLPANVTTKGVTWSSSNNSVATVNSSTGEVTCVSDGVVTITAAAKETPTVKATRTFYVFSEPPVIQEEVKSGIADHNRPGDTFNLTFQGPPEVTWLSSNNNVATVDTVTGAVTCVSEGKVTITAKSKLSPFKTDTRTFFVYNDGVRDDFIVEDDTLTINKADRLTNYAITQLDPLVKSGIKHIVLNKDATTYTVDFPALADADKLQNVNKVTYNCNTNAIQELVSQASKIDIYVNVNGLPSFGTYPAMIYDRIRDVRFNGTAFTTIWSINDWNISGDVYFADTLTDITLATTKALVGRTGETKSKVYLNDASNRLTKLAYTSTVPLFKNFDISEMRFGKKLSVITGTPKNMIFECEGTVTLLEDTYAANWANANFNSMLPFVISKQVPPSAITLNRTTLTITPGSTFQLVATVYPTGATDKEVTWESSNPEVGTIDADGKFTAIADGVTDIVALTSAGQAATCKITVKETKYVDRINVSSTVTVAVDETRNLDAVALPADADDLSLGYVSADPTIVSVNTAGVLTGNKEGKTNITITAKGKPTVTAVVEVTVTPKKVTAPVGITVNAPAGYTSQKVPITITTTGSVKYIQLPNGNIVNATTFTYYATQNGSYSFTAVGELGDQATAKQIITTMDKINPIITINSTITDTETVYEINVIDTDSGFKSLTLPDKSVITSLPYTYHQTESGTVTITASDNANNISTKELTRGQISIPGTSSTTFIAYEGIPKEWTNQPANIQVAAFNPVDGVDLAIGPATAPKMKMFSMFSAPELSKTAVFKDVTVTENSTVPVTVTSVDGANQVIPLVIDKIDTTPPEATYTVDNGLVTVVATDSQSGVREVINPAGEVADTFTAEFDGTYRFMLMDNADNITPFDVVVTMGAEPPVPILPPAELTESGTQSVEIIGTVMPEGSGSSTLLSVVIPTSLDFVIDADRKFIGADYTFKNTGTSNAVISITEVTPLDGTTTQIVTPNKYADWTSLDKDATRNFIALLLGDVSLHAPAELTKLPAGSTKYLTLSGKYGHAWDNVASLLLKYKVSLHITTTP